jgi:hypothetical protein
VWSVLKDFVNYTVKRHSDTTWSSKAAAVNSISRQHEKSWLLNLNTCVILRPKRLVHARMQLWVSMALKSYNSEPFYWLDSEMSYRQAIN